MVGDTVAGLVIDRKVGQSIRIGEHTELVFMKAINDMNKVRLKFIHRGPASEELLICRSEIYEQMKAKRKR